MEAETDPDTERCVGFIVPACVSVMRMQMMYQCQCYPLLTIRKANERVCIVASFTQCVEDRDESRITVPTVPSLRLFSRYNNGADE